MESKCLSLILILAFISALPGQADGRQVNVYDQSFTYKCPSGQLLSYVASHHHNKKEDRVFILSCRPLPTAGKPINCRWSGFRNSFDGGLSYRCPNEGFFAGIASYHNNHHEDRRYDLYCCELPGYTTGFDEVHVNQCSNEGYVARMNNGREDKRSKLCCQLPNRKAQNCRWTGYLNHFDQYFRYVVPDGHIIRGISSYHDNRHEDRRFNFLVCDLNKHYPRCILPA